MSRHVSLLPLTILCALCALPSATSVVNLSLALSDQTEKLDWYKPLPRPEYKSFERVATPDPWFEVYKVAPNTFAIYEPHQAEKVITYLILDKKCRTDCDYTFLLAAAP